MSLPQKLFAGLVVILLIAILASTVFFAKVLLDGQTYIMDYILSAREIPYGAHVGILDESEDPNSLTNCLFAANDCDVCWREHGNKRNVQGEYSDFVCRAVRTDFCRKEKFRCLLGSRIKPEDVFWSTESIVSDPNDLDRTCSVAVGQCNTCRKESNIDPFVCTQESCEGELFICWTSTPSWGD